MHWWLKQEAPTSISRSSSHGLEVIHDFNQKNFSEAGKIVDTKSDKDIIYIGVPCFYSMNK